MIPYFRIFRVFRHSVPSFRQSAIPPNSVTPDIFMSKKILNARLIIVPRIESVSYILKRQIIVL